MKIVLQRCGFAAFSFLLVISAFGQDDSGQSLADVARKLRKDTTNEVKMTDADTKKLFESVDRIFAFAAEDTEMPKHAAVKRRLVSKADVEQYAAGQMAKEEYAKALAQGEPSMKKLGFLPREFNLKEFLVKSTGQGIAAYYDDETKTISMLNWVPPDRQEPILAHELTHALQDQNYDLAKWMKPKKKLAEGGATDDSAVARKAVVEGQAMVVYVDYLLKPLGRSLEDTPGLVYQMEEPAVKAVIDSQMMHDAPIILREMGAFPYQQGLIFEGELLHAGGKKMAFAGAFARPPRNSHEVLEPDAYIRGEKLPAVSIPDMKDALNDQYDLYDSGGIGELDVRALLKQYGERKAADEVSAEWQGGAYATFRRKDKTVSDVVPTTADLSLLYVSRWKTPQVADWFARFYVRSLSQRYHSATVQPSVACSEANCQASSTLVVTEEGPVIVELWKDNSVIVSESFDPAMAAKLRTALRDGASATHAQNLPQEEIGFRLLQSPTFQSFERQVGEQIKNQMWQAHMWQESQR
ncbi:MAG: hypothetical protein ABR874_18925 [Candidatus Sulfotelmatobacter sp.]|jgi:hypothetical protein